MSMSLAIVGGLVVFLLGSLLVVQVAALQEIRRTVARILEVTEQLRTPAEHRPEVVRPTCGLERRHRDARAVVQAVGRARRAIVRELRRASVERRRALHRLIADDRDLDPPPSFGAPPSGAAGAPSTLRSRAPEQPDGASLPPGGPAPSKGRAMLKLLMGGQRTKEKRDDA